MLKLYSTIEERDELDKLYQTATAENDVTKRKKAFISFIERFSDIYLNAHGTIRDGNRIRAFICSIMDNHCDVFSSFKPLDFLENENQDFFLNKKEQSCIDKTDSTNITERIVAEIMRKPHISEENAICFLSSFCQQLYFLLNSPTEE